MQPLRKLYDTVYSKILLISQHGSYEMFNPWEAKKREIEDKQKTYNKTVDLSSSMSTITLNVDGLNIPIKRQRLPIYYTRAHAPTHLPLLCVRNSIQI